MIHRLDGGNYWTDGGAMMGVLPWSIWGKSVTLDERRRKQLALNLLLIRVPDHVIVVDTGIGNRLHPKLQEIYRPTPFMLPVSLAEYGVRDTDVTDVVLTHLHFDHAGGVITGFGDSEALTFPKARHWVQKAEWDVAKDPDGVNRAAYDFEHQLSLLEQRHRVEVIDGDANIAPGVNLKLVGGHSIGSQIVEVDTPDGFYIYAADIIPTMFHTSPAVTSAYDLNRKDTFKAKQYIYHRLKEKQGSLLLNHDMKRWEVPIAELRV